MNYNAMLSMIKTELDKQTEEIKRYLKVECNKGYKDGYIHGQGIGYQDGKYQGYAKAVKTIMKGRY